MQRQERPTGLRSPLVRRNAQTSPHPFIAPPTVEWHLSRAMLRELNDMWVRITGQSEADLLVSLSEVDPAMALEAGFILPEPGHEKAWFEEHKDKLAQLGVTG